MNEYQWRAAQFEMYRAHLRVVIYRMLEAMSHWSGFVRHSYIENKMKEEN